MKIRLNTIIIGIVLVILIQFGIFFLSLTSVSQNAKILEETQKTNQFQVLQHNANIECVRLAGVEGFWVDQTIYCKAVFGGFSRILPYEELENIVNSQK